MTLIRAMLTLIIGFGVGDVALSQSPYPAGTQIPRILVPYPPGSGPDRISRHLTQELNGLWGISPIVENKIGASGIVAINEFKRATPERPTLLFLTNEQLAVNRAVYKSLPYDVEKDFIPLAGIYQSTFVIVASEASGIKSVSDLIRIGKEKAGKLTYASNGKGSLGHLSGEALSSGAGIAMTHVPIRNLGELSTSVGAGDIDLVFITPPAIRSLVQSRRAQMVATLSPDRQPQLPTVPTIVQSGGPEIFHVRGWSILATPTNTPKETVDRLRTDLQTVMQKERFKQALMSAGVDPWPVSSEIIKWTVMDEYQAYRRIATDASIQLE